LARHWLAHWVQDPARWPPRHSKSQLKVARRRESEQNDPARNHPEGKRGVYALKYPGNLLSGFRFLVLGCLDLGQPETRISVFRFRVPVWTLESPNPELPVSIFRFSAPCPSPCPWNWEWFPVSGIVPLPVPLESAVDFRFPVSCFAPLPRAPGIGSGFPVSGFRLRAPSCDPGIGVGFRFLVSEFVPLLVILEAGADSGFRFPTPV